MKPRTYFGNFLGMIGLCGFLVHCVPNRPGSASKGSDPMALNGVGDNRPLHEAFEISESQWQQFVKKIGQEPFDGRFPPGLNRAVCFEEGASRDENAALQSSSCPYLPPTTPVDPQRIFINYEQYWKEIGLDFKRMTVGQWKEAQRIFSGVQGSSAFSLVEPAKGPREKAKVCVHLINLYGEYRSAKYDPDCGRKIIKMSQLVMNPRTYETLIRGSEIVHVAAKAADLFFPHKGFAKELKQVNRLNQCAILPAHQLRKGVGEMSRALGDAVIKNDL